MNASPSRLPLNQSLKTLLTAVTGFPAAIASPPLDENGSQAEYPYIVIYPIIGGGYSGADFCGGTEDAEWHYQITVYGERDDQVELAHDKAREALIGRDEFNRYSYDLPYSPGKVTLRSPVGPTGRLVREGQVFKTDEDYSIRVTTRV